MTGHELRDLRLSLGLTQHQFADRVGFHRSAIARYEAENSVLPELRERFIRIEFNMPASRASIVDDQTGDLFPDHKPK